MDNIKTAMIIGLLVGVWLTIVAPTIDEYVEEYIVDENSYFGEARSYKSSLNILVTLILILFIIKQKPTKEIQM